MKTFASTATVNVTSNDNCSTAEYSRLFSNVFIMFIAAFDLYESYKLTSTSLTSVYISSHAGCSM